MAKKEKKGAQVERIKIIKKTNRQTDRLSRERQKIKRHSEDVHNDHRQTGRQTDPEKEKKTRSATAKAGKSLAQVPLHHA